MMNKLIVVALAILLQACATGPRYTPMTETTKQAISSVEVYSLVVQDEVKPSVKLSNATGALGGGLIAAAIDSSVNDDRAASALDIIEPLYNATLDVDYRELLAQEFNPALSSKFNVTGQKPRAEAVNLFKKDVEAKLKTLKSGEGFLVLSSYYQFHNDFKMLQTSMSAFLYTATDKKASFTKPAYHNTVVYQSPHVGAGGQGSIEKWSENDGELFRKELQSSLTASKDMLMYDMEPILSEECLSGAKVRVPNVLNVTTVKGQLISTEGGANLVRGNNGALYSVPESKIVKISTKKCKGNS